MTVQYRITRILSTLLIAGLCSAPLLRAQQTNPATPQQATETSQQPTQPAQSARSCNSPGAEHAARGSGKQESAAASIAWDKRESVASAARARYNVS